MYQNIARIGFTYDAQSNLDGLAGNENEPLIIVNGSTGSPIATIVPPKPWSTQSLKAAIEQHADAIEAADTADAFLGATFLGSTEL